MRQPGHGEYGGAESEARQCRFNPLADPGGHWQRFSGRKSRRVVTGGARTRGTGAGTGGASAGMAAGAREPGGQDGERAALAKDDEGRPEGSEPG
jgi:hypothetical protein